ncbi:ACT domain-containing protein [Scatolibacter rhodanostii]|uniref:ACT domain-containing protein n=1 Tax=Scatolibacter rhodanostii TaxID=2014781 RepID=UPI001FA9252E|nr:ACT domain-containing protein [Scatolibacter rhodanostii]
MSATITATANITLVTLQGFPANIKSVSDILAKIASYHINIDMISMAPTHGASTGLSFSISDEDLVEMLAFTSELKKQLGINVIVSSVNHKISIHDEIMRHTPGIAARVFAAIADTDADIRLITTSEVEISLLVSEADYDTVLSSLEKNLI